MAHAEIDAPANKKILAMVITVIISLVLVVFGVEQYYDASVRAEIDRKSNGVEDPRKKQTNASTADCLKGYQYLDPTNQTVRIDVAKAEELVLADWDKRPVEPVTTHDIKLPDAVVLAVPPSASQPATQAATQPTTAPAPAPATAPASQPAH